MLNTLTADNVCRCLVCIKGFIFCDAANKNGFSNQNQLTDSAWRMGEIRLVEFTDYLLKNDIL
jgi:hypothetical protein